jgi:hypothetical protein
MGTTGAMMTPTDRARETTRSFVNRQADNLASQAGNRAGRIAANVRRIAETWRASEFGALPADVAVGGANYIEGCSWYLKETDGARLLADAEGLAARNPLLAAGVAYLAGFAAMRFLRTTPE